MKGRIAVLVFYYLIANAFSQNVTEVSGTVKDSSTGLPVEGAFISLNEIQKQTITDAQGMFRFRQVPLLEGTLTLSHVSYTSKTISFSSSGESPVILEILLSQKITSLREVIVEDARIQGQVISNMPYVETTIVRDQIKREATRDVTDFLRNSNNINGIRKGGTQLDPVVRGLKFSQLNVQLNTGQKIEGGCPNRMDPAAAHIEIDDVESIEVIKGPYALRYGPMFGGLINIKTRSQFQPDSLHLQVNAGLGYESNWNGFKQNIEIIGGSPKFLFDISGGMKNYGNYSDGNGNLVNSSFDKYNYAAEFGFRPAENHTIRAGLDASYGRNIRFPTLPMDERKDDTRLYSIDYEGTNVSGLLSSLVAKLYLSDVYHEMDNKNRPFSDTVVAVSEINAETRGGRFEAGFDFAGGVLKPGFDVEEITKDGNRQKNMIKQPGLPQKIEKLWNNAVIQNLGFFAEYSRAIDAWEFLGALRIDRNRANSDDIDIKFPGESPSYHYDSDSTQSEYTNFSFSFGVTKWFSRSFAVSLSLGSGTRSPDVTERFIILLPIGYDRFDYLGNPKLKPETNNQIDLTLKYVDEQRGMLQLNGFYSMINNFITGIIIPPSIQKPLTKDVLGVKQFENSGQAKLRGFELGYASPQKYNWGLSVFASYTYGTIDEVEQYVMNENGEVVGNEVINNDAMTEIPPFEGTVAFHWELFRNRFVPKLSTRLVAAQNHVSEASYERSSNAFVLTNFSLTYLFNYYLNLSAGVNNLFDIAYFEHLNRNIIGSDKNLNEPGRSFYINLYFNL
jgi:iron complex outermembrane receptor protein